MKSTEYRVQSTDQISLSVKRSVSETVCQQSGLSGEAGLPAIVGITGGIGSGKSTIARALAARGYAVYDCDQVRKAIIGLLGTEAFTASPEHPFTGIYNTAYVAERVFAEPELLERLNQIVHPAVKRDILERSGHRATPVLFIESAILYEAGLDGICDKIIVVDAPEEVRIARTIQRDYHGEASDDNINKVRARIRAQKARRFQPSDISCQLVVQNDGKASIDELVAKILQNL